MSIFIYAIEKEGKMLQGEIQAPSLQLAQIKLQSRNIKPVYIKKKPLASLLGNTSTSSRSILFFTRQLSFLLESGVSLVEAIDMIIESVKEPHFKQVLIGMSQQIEGGKSFSYALKSRSDIFSNFYIHMIVCAEETGLLDKILKELADYMERAEAIKSKVKSASLYPIIVLCISFSIITGIIMFIVPKFEALYSGNQKQLPALTQVLVDMSSFMRENALLLLFFIFASVVSFMVISRTTQGKKQIQGFITLLPIFSKIQYHAALVRSFRSFYYLLNSGVFFVRALEIVYDLVDHDKLQKGMKHAKGYVLKGKSFSLGLKSSNAFPSMVNQMIRIGEESGKIAFSFEKLSKFYETELENLIDGLIKLIEPILIVFLGGIISVIILALYLPIFNMGDIVS